MTGFSLTNRRTFVAGSALCAALPWLAACGEAASATSTRSFRITRTDAQWRDRLTRMEYFVLREFGTEEQRSSPLWNEKRPGTYCCKGCDLTIYRSLHKMQLSKGWAFFRHSYPNTVLTDLDLRLDLDVRDGAIVGAVSGCRSAPFFKNAI